MDLLNKRSSHLRTLSTLGVDLARDVDNLEIKDMLARADEEGGPNVAGLNDRIRLQRSSQAVANGPSTRNWMDAQRANVQAYEYLCRVSEAKAWLERCLKQAVPSVVELEEDLRNGIVLAKLARVFAPDLVPRIFEAPKLQFRHSDNINRFFHFIDRINLPRNFRFELTDLYDKKNIPRVIYCIHALSYVLATRGQAIGIDNLSGQVEFSDEELRNTQRNLDTAGAMPNFSSVASVLVGNADKEAKRRTLPTPVVAATPPVAKAVRRKTSGELRREAAAEREERLGQAERSIVALQSRARGYVLRKAYYDNADTYQQIEAWTMHLQRRGRGLLYRQSAALAVARADAMEASVLPLQTVGRGWLVRHDLSITRRQLQRRSRIVEALQARSRAWLVRRQLTTQRAQVQRVARPVARLQAIARAFLVRKRAGLQKQATKAASTGVRSCQQVARGYLVRREVQQKRRHVQRNERCVVDLQRCARGMRMRQKIRGLRLTLSHEMSFIEALQARGRGCLIRGRCINLFRQLVRVEADVEAVQALARGVLVRVEKERMYRHYLRNIDQVIRAQSVVRARQQGAAYRSLMHDQNPSLGTIKAFVHLLDDSDADFEEEVAIEDLRRSIITLVRENERAEEHVEQMDIKIALLVKQAIKLEDVIQHHHSLNAGGIGGKAAAPTTQFDLKGLNKQARHMVECYQKLFYVLQTQPVYLARLFLDAEHTLADEKDLKQMDSCAMVLFGYAKKRREEYFLLKLLRSCVFMEIAHGGPRRFEAGEAYWERVFACYLKGIQQGRILSDVIGPVVESILADDFLDLESDPVLIYKSITVDEELRTGRPSQRRRDIVTEDAVADPDTRVLFIKHLRDLRDLTKQLLNALDRHVDLIPYGVRYLAREAFKALQECSDAPRTANLIDAVGKVVFNQFLIKVLKQPDLHGMVATTCGLAQRKNLADVARMLEQVVAGRLFDEHSFLAPLNEFIDGLFPRVERLLERLIDVPDSEQHFGVSALEDVVATKRPTLYVKTPDLFFVHHILHTHLATIAPGRDDPVHEILQQMGTPPTREEDMSLKSLTTTEVSLTLDPKAVDIEDPDADEQSLFLQTKRWVLYILRTQPGETLLDILITPPEDEDEDFWQDLLARERSRTRPSPQQARLRDLSFAELKRDTLQNIIRLEDLGWISRVNGYQELLNAIAVDVKSQVRRRVERRTELHAVRCSLQDLEEKRHCLGQQLQSYNEYIAHAMTSLQGKKGKKSRSVLPFTKQYFHLKSLEKTGSVPRFGSRRYAGAKLHARGVLVDIADDSPPFDRHDVAISSDQVGTFKVALFGANRDAVAHHEVVQLDALLQAQFDKTEYFDLCHNRLRVRVNPFLDMLFKHFFQ